MYAIFRYNINIFLALMKKNQINCLQKTVQPNIVIQLNLQNIGFKFNAKE